jgi:hypothetical protein
MFKLLKCLLKGHKFVDSRSAPGTQVCVRCRRRQPFEAFAPTPPAAASHPADGPLPPGD